LKAKIYPEEDVMIVQWEHSDENVYFSKFSLSSQEWLNNDYIADNLEMDCVKNVVDFSWDKSTKLFHVLQKDNEGSFRCVVGNEDFSEWKKVELQQTKEVQTDKILDHLSKPMIHENFIETHSIAYVLNECYDIETGNYNITRENLMTEIQNRFIPKTSSTTINNTMSFLSKSNINFNETIPETALYDLYRSIIDHEHTQNIPYSLSGNMILFKNRVGFIHEKPLSNDSLSDIDHLYEKLLIDCLDPEDFQNNQRDSQAIFQSEQYSWNTAKITTSFESYPLLKNRLFATLQLQVISTTIKEVLNSAYNFNSWPEKSLLKKLKRMALTYKTFFDRL